jgi:hypothetical protein
VESNWVAIEEFKDLKIEGLVGQRAKLVLVLEIPGNPMTRWPGGSMRLPQTARRVLNPILKSFNP